MRPHQHLVMASKVNRSTRLLRELVALLEGIKPVAHLLQTEAADVARWTQKGLPEHMVQEITNLHHRFVASEGLAQNPDFTTEQAFPLLFP